MEDYVFYKKDSHEFSAFHPSEIIIDSKSWPSPEHYFQAMKYSGIDESYVEKIRVSDSPSKAYRLAWSRDDIRKDWDSIRDGVMKKAMLAKFIQHGSMWDMLDKTGGSYIIQRCPKDKYWGDGYPGAGVNMLGKILVEVRDLIRLFYSLEYPK